MQIKKKRNFFVLVVFQCGARNTNHMLNNPVQSKSRVITTRQKRHLSDLPLRLSLDGQNIENVTQHGLIGLTVDNKLRWQAQIEHIRKSM